MSLFLHIQFPSGFNAGLFQHLSYAQQKAKLEAKLHQTTSAAAAAAASGVGPIHNSVPSNPSASASSAPGFFIHPSDVIPPTPKTTPLFMTPPLHRLTFLQR